MADPSWKDGIILKVFTRSLCGALTSLTSFLDHEYRRISPFLGFERIHSCITVWNLLQRKGDIHHSCTMGIPHLVGTSF